MNDSLSSFPEPEPLSQNPIDPAPFSELTFDESTISLLPRPNFPSICFMSLNINKANYIRHAVLNSFIDTTDVILFQEPWKGRIGTARSDTVPEGVAIYGMVHQNSWRQFIPVPPDASSANPARVSTYVTRRDIHVYVTQRTDLIQHPDIVIIEMKVPGRPPFLVINIYNDTHSSGIKALMQVHLPEMAIIITGDFNLHHPMWSPENHHQSPFSDALVDWMESHQFLLLNNPGEITFDRAGQLSVLDLTWINKRAIDIGLVKDWAIRHDISVCSDHFPTIWNVPISRPPPEVLGLDLPKFRFSIDHAGEWVSLVKEKAEPVFTNEILSAESITESQLDHIIGTLHDAMVEASIKTMRASKFKPSSSP